MFEYTESPNVYNVYVYCNMFYWHELWIVQELRTHWREAPPSFRREAPDPGHAGCCAALQPPHFVLVILGEKGK